MNHNIKKNKIAVVTMFFFVLSSFIFLKVSPVFADSGTVSINGYVVDRGGGGGGTTPAPAPAPAPTPTPEPTSIPPTPEVPPTEITPPRISPPAVPPSPRGEVQHQPQENNLPAISDTGAISIGLSSNEQSDYNDVLVFGANGSVRLFISNSIINDLSGDRIYFYIPESVLAPRPLEGIELVLGGNRIPFVLNQTSRRYEAVSTVPNPGNYFATIDVRYVGGTSILPFTMQSVARGVVNDILTNVALTNSIVTLYDENNGEHIWNGSLFNQQNPQTTDANGHFSFVVPNGRYRLSMIKDGYYEYFTNSFTVQNNIINQSQHLFSLSTPLWAVRVAGFLFTAQDWAARPDVQDATKKYVIPGAVITIVAVEAPSLIGIIFPLLRYLFLQPLLFLGRGKRQKWGQVYNSLTKLPVELAIVRLINNSTNKIVQTRCTDMDGRYLFIVEPGSYRIEVSKGDFAYPTKVLINEQTDGRLLDLYHGEPISVSEDGSALTPNIPLDPRDQNKTPDRIIWTKRLRVFQYVMSLSGIIVTTISLLILPTLYTALFLVAHIGIYVLVVKFVIPRKPSGWGVVYDTTNKIPVSKVIARLFAKNMNKLVDTQITDKKGRYAFLTGPNDYYVTFEKGGYKKTETSEISLKDKETGELFVGQDVGLEPKAAITPPPETGSSTLPTTPPTVPPASASTI